MVAPDEFEDIFAARIGTGQTNGAHGRLGAGVDHADHFHGRKEGRDEPGQGHFVRRRRAVAGAMVCRFLDGLADHGGGMPQQKGAVGQDVINVTVSVGVHHMTSFTPDQERRNAADTAERTDGAVDAAGHDFFAAANSASDWVIS